MEDFKKNIYCKNYFHYCDSQWYKNKQAFITDNSIKGHIEGLLTLAYTYKYTVDIVSIDIDKDKSYLFDTNKDILEKYQYIISKLGNPSLVFKSHSNGGLHLYYKLDKKIFIPIIHNQLYKRLELKNITGIELLPTHNKPLRMLWNTQQGGQLLNNDLKIIDIVTKRYDYFLNYYQNAKVHNINDFFEYTDEIVDFILYDNKRKNQKINYAKVKRFDYHLNKILPLLKSGNTNKSIEKLCFNAFVNGYNEELTYKHILNEIDKKYINKDYDLQPKRLLNRIKNHFKRFNKQKDKIINNQIEKKPLNFLDNDEIINRVKKILDEVYNASLKNIDLHSLKKMRKEDFTKRKQSIKKLLYKMIEWQLKINKLTDFEKHCINIRYPYFYNLTSKMMIPFVFTIC